MNAPVVIAENLSRHYEVGGGLFRKGQPLCAALSETSFTLYPGKTLAVVGESGCGKSTLARVITMIEDPTSGTFSIARHAGFAGELGRACAPRCRSCFRIPTGR